MNERFKNGTTCMCEKRVSKSTNVHAKHYYACDNSEMLTKTETVLVQANMHANDSKHSQKSSKQHSHKPKHKKRHKRCKRQVKRTYPKIAEMDVSKTPGCVVGCQSSKIDVKNEL